MDCEYSCVTWLLENTTANFLYNEGSDGMLKTIVVN